MNISKLKIYLFLAGVVLILVGGFIAVLPSQYIGKFAIENYNQDLLSELRGLGGSLFFTGTFILLGAFLKKIANSALVVSLLVFSSFVFFRTLGLIIDGTPNYGIIAALIIEIVLLMFGLVLLKNSSKPNTSHEKKVCLA